jgi:hypothetical protein
MDPSMLTAATLSLPLAFEQRSSRSSTALALVLLVPVVGSVLIPAILLAVHARDVAAAASENPGAAAQAIVGLLLWVGLFVVPVIRIASRFGCDRTVLMCGANVTVYDVSPFGVSEVVYWQSSFAGIVHVVRTSLSGVRHELLLVQKETGRQIVFHAADTLGQQAVDDVCRALGLPEIPAAQLLSFSGGPQTAPDYSGAVAV